MSADTIARRARAALAEVSVLAQLQRRGRLTMGQLSDHVCAVGPLAGEGEPVVLASVDRLAAEGLVTKELGTCVITLRGAEELERVEEEMLRVLAIETPASRWPRTTRSSPFISKS